MLYPLVKHALCTKYWYVPDSHASLKRMTSLSSYASCATLACRSGMSASLPSNFFFPRSRSKPIFITVIAPALLRFCAWVVGRSEIWHMWGEGKNVKNNGTLKPNSTYTIAKWRGTQGADRLVEQGVVQLPSWPLTVNDSTFVARFPRFQYRVCACG